jgi:hypothetical protein
MPVPEPRPGFEDRVLVKASARQFRAPSEVRPLLRRPMTWWAAGGGALAATLVWAMLTWMQSGAQTDPSLVLALYESREVPLVIDSERNLDGATIRIYVTGSVALAGYEQQHEVEWQSSLNKGVNLLSLPVVGYMPGDGLVVAEIEHEGRTRRVSVAMHVSGDRA